MKVRDILKQKHTLLASVDGYVYHQGLFDYTQVIVNLETILFGFGNKYKESIELLRKLPYHSEKQLLYKQEFPVWFVGGTFPEFEVKDGNIKTFHNDCDIIDYSNILAIDIDKQDNPNIDLEKIVNDIYELPYVFAKLLSISGQGYYLLILVENGKNTKEHYRYIHKLFKQKYNVNIDSKCKNIGRKRFISYQDNIKENIKPLNTEIIPFKLLEFESDCLFDNEIMTRMIDYKPQKFKESEHIEFARKAIWKLLDNGYSVDDINTKDNRYTVWYYIGCDFRLFNDGYDMFIKFSSNSSKYNDDIGTINKKWNQTSLKRTTDDICRKWCGICKNKFGKDWFK